MTRHVPLCTRLGALALGLGWLTALPACLGADPEAEAWVAQARLSQAEAAALIARGAAAEAEARLAAFLEVEPPPSVAREDVSAVHRDSYFQLAELALTQDAADRA